MTRFAIVALAAAGTDSADTYLVAALVLGGIALLLLALEVFIPTGGILALLCGACAVASVVAMFMWSTAGGLVLLLVYTVAAPFLVLAFLRFWARSPIARAFTLTDDARVVAEPQTPFDVDPGDPDAAQAANDAQRRHRSAGGAKLVGASGIAETPLRPAGFVLLDGRRIDAVAETGLIDAGTPVRIVSVQDGVVKVRAQGSSAT